MEDIFERLAKLEKEMDPTTPYSTTPVSMSVLTEHIRQAKELAKVTAQAVLALKDEVRQGYRKVQ